MEELGLDANLCQTHAKSEAALSSDYRLQVFCWKSKSVLTPILTQFLSQSVLIQLSQILPSPDLSLEFRNSGLCGTGPEAPASPVSLRPH